MGTKIKTAVITNAGKAELVERDRKKLAEHEVLVKIKACNLCTCEYGVFNGSRTNRPLPLVFGHEWSGEVVEVGSKVLRVEKGDYVAAGYVFDPYSEPSCEGRTGECPRIPGSNRENDDGYFGNAGCAEYAVLDEVGLHKVKDGIDPSVAAFLEPLATCCNGFRHFDMKFGETLVVIGAGTMGMLNALVAKAHGVRVIVTEMMPKKLETARRLGLDVIDVSKCDAVKRVKEMTDGKGADGVIVAVGATGAYDQAIDMLKDKRGKMLLFAAGYPAPALHIDPNTIHYRRMHIIGCYGADYIDFKEAMYMINQNVVDLDTLVEERIPLDEIQKAFEESCKPGMFRVSVVC